MINKQILCTIGVLALVGMRAFGDSPTTRPANEFYIGGEVVRPGVYAIPENAISVLQAVSTAETKDADRDYEVEIIQRVGSHKLERITLFSSLKALRESPEAAIDLSPGDIVQVNAVKR